MPRNYSRAKEKVDRIVSKFPEILQNDTVVLKDTILIPEIVLDTVARLQENDTIVIEKERLRVQVVRMPGDTVEIQAECKTDTIVLTRTVPVYTVEKHNIIKKEFLGLSLWIWALIAAVVILLLIVIFRRRR